METIKTFTVRFDERTKQILISLLVQAETQITEQIASGNYQDVVLASYEELAMVKRGILLTPPDEPEVNEPKSETNEIDLDLS